MKALLLSEKEKSIIETIKNAKSPIERDSLIHGFSLELFEKLLRELSENTLCYDDKKGVF